MLISALIPFIFLSKSGRKGIGLKFSKKLKFISLALVAGIVLSLLLYFMGVGLYGYSYENWYVYIGKSYNIPEVISPDDNRVMFIIVAITGMIFSPVGEELFFRGIVHGSFANSIGDKKASIVDSFAFAITHIAHFGLVYVNDSWKFYVVPTFIWVVSMFCVSFVFFKMKKLSDSLSGAIICHSGFNLGMTYSIFYLL
jgi:membrane protease YdiL (CAAX protease family)